MMEKEKQSKQKNNRKSNAETDGETEKDNTLNLIILDLKYKEYLEIIF